MNSTVRPAKKTANQLQCQPEVESQPGDLEHFTKKGSLTVEAATADAVRPPATMCSLEYPEVTISSIALTTSAVAVHKGYRKKGNALG